MSLSPLDGNPADIIPEGDLPFVRTKIATGDEDEDQEGSIRTMKVWVVDVPDPRKASFLLKWVKDAGLETPDLIHLRRIRRLDSVFTLLLSSTASPPSIPEALALPRPYQTDVPESVALTPKSLKVKLQIWPTVYAPKRKGEPESWSRAKVSWAREAVETLRAEAERAATSGELSVVSYIPRPFAEESDQEYEPDTPCFLSCDTRRSTSNSLRHSVTNVIRKVADWRASQPSSRKSNNFSLTALPFSPETVDTSSSGASQGLELSTGSSGANGAHYLLTSFTLFTTHEPCVMCSMALLHSRVREIVFLRPMDATGGCGGHDGRGICVPRLKGVNHRYNIMRWKVEENERADWVALLNVAEDVDA